MCIITCSTAAAAAARNGRGCCHAHAVLNLKTGSTVLSDTSNVHFPCLLLARRRAGASFPVLAGRAAAGLVDRGRAARVLLRCLWCCPLLHLLLARGLALLAAVLAVEHAERLEELVCLPRLL